MLWRLVLGLAALAVLGGAALFTIQSKSDAGPFSPNPVFSERLRPLTIENFTIAVAIADSSEERSLGLSGTTALPPDTGLLFVFASDNLAGFWMKDMLFPIDIIWISANGEVVGIEENVAPDTYPTIFQPKEPIRYVLEVPAGFSAARGIQKSSKISVEMAL